MRNDNPDLTPEIGSPYCLAVSQAFHLSARPVTSPFCEPTSPIERRNHRFAFAKDQIKGEGHEARKHRKSQGVIGISEHIGSYRSL
jgi:hypothetical protein